MVTKAKKEPTQRQLRVGEEIRHILADVFLKDDLFVPELTGQTLMVTEVRISPDFSIATAFVRPVGEVDTDAIVKALNEHKGFFRKFMGQNLRLRITPDIRFLKDKSFDEAAKIEALFNDPKVKADIEKED